MDADSLFIIRPYKTEDLNFVKHSWGSSYYKGADYVTFLSPKEFNSKHRQIRDEILHRPNIAILIACSKRDEDLILGWILVEKPKSDGIIFHYIYVKEAFKGEGISDKLMKKALPNKPILVTHMTDRARKIIRKKKDHFKDFEYHSELIMIRDNYLNIFNKGLTR